MQLSRVFLIVIVSTHVILTEAFFLPLGLVSLGVAGLVSLKLYYGFKMIGPAIRSARDSFEANLPFGHHEQKSVAWEQAPTKLARMFHNGKTIRDVLILPLAIKPEPIQKKTRRALRARRDSSNGVQLSGGFLKWLDDIDDNKCIHRFLCELGADQDKFGNLGRITNMLVMMGGLPKESWAHEMYSLGQKDKKCEFPCDQRELSKTVDYLERHIFVPPVDDQEAVKEVPNELSDQ